MTRRQTIALLAAFILGGLLMYGLGALAASTRQWFVNVQRPHTMHSLWTIYDDGEIKERLKDVE